MKKSFISIMTLFIFSILAAGCQLFFMDTSSIIATEVSSALETKMSEMESAADADQASIPEVAPVNTQTPYPTYTPYPTPQPATYSAYNYSYAIGTPGGCLGAIFISENYPDNTVFSPGDAFIKTWTIKNTGYCTWNTNYHLVLVSGSAMGGDTYTPLPKSVAPGETITLSANLTAPSADGTYRGEWRVQTDLGLNFARFWVQIVVK
jgi:hypothetical protein